MVVKTEKSTNRQWKKHLYGGNKVDEGRRIDWKDCLDEKINGKMEVGRGMMVWELYARLSLEHAEVWLTGGQTAPRKF